MKKKYNPYSSKNALFVSLALSLFCHLLLVRATAFNFRTTHDVAYDSISYDILLSYFGTVVFLFILFKYSFWISQKNIEPIKKNLIILIGLLLLAIPLSIFFSYIYNLLLSNPKIYFGNEVVYKKLLLDNMYAFIVFLITLSISIIIRSQKLEAESVRYHYEALKNQLNPHFLFNTLNTLDGLIGHDDEKAHHYLQNLSLTFRHAIQREEVVELSEELKLVEAYFYMMKIRYGESIHLHHNINEKHKSCFVLHISLQLLIENAVKHNAINDKYPLTIMIETTDDCKIRVANNKNWKWKEDESTGIGLANLSERYMLQYGKEVKVIDNPDIFCVEIPLIEQVQSKS